MKVRINIIGMISYNTQVEMTPAQFELWQKKIDHAHNSFYQHTVAEKLMDVLGMETNNPTDWLPLHVDTFEEAVPYRMAPP